MPRWLLLCLLLFALNGFASEKLIIEPDMGRAPVLNAIHHTQNKIQLVMYGFTDTAFTSALLHAAYKKKDVSVLIQRFPYKLPQENQSSIEKMQTAPIQLQWADGNFQLTHQKTFIFDETRALIMSFNLTRSAFETQRNFALFIDQPAEVAEIVNVFNADWQHQQYIPSVRNLVWSPDNSRQKILSLIKKAKKDIKIYAESLSDYQIIEALAHAARQHIKVRIITNPDDKHLFKRKYDFLKKSGVVFSFNHRRYIHAKALLIDDKSLMIGSINFTKASLDNNRELSIISHDDETITEFLRIFTHDWQEGKKARSVKRSNPHYPFLKQVLHLIEDAIKPTLRN